MTAKQWTEKTVKELAKRKARKNKALECELIGIEINRYYRAKRELMP